MESSAFQFRFTIKFLANVQPFTFSKNQKTEYVLSFKSPLKKIYVPLKLVKHNQLTQSVEINEVFDFPVDFSEKKNSLITVKLKTGKKEVWDGILDLTSKRPRQLTSTGNINLPMNKGPFNNSIFVIEYFASLTEDEDLPKKSSRRHTLRNFIGAVANVATGGDISGNLTPRGSSTPRNEKIDTYKAMTDHTEKIKEDYNHAMEELKKLERKVQLKSNSLKKKEEEIELLKVQKQEYFDNYSDLLVKNNQMNNQLEKAKKEIEELKKELKIKSGTPYNLEDILDGNHIGGGDEDNLDDEDLDVDDLLDSEEGEVEVPVEKPKRKDSGVSTLRLPSSDEKLKEEKKGLESLLNGQKDVNEELSEKIKSFESDLVQLKNELDQERIKCSNKQVEIQSIEQERQSLQVQLATKTQDHNDLKDQLDKSTSKIQSLETELNHLKNLKQTLEDENEQGRNKLKSLSEEFTSLETEMKHKGRQLNDVQQERDSANSRLEEMNKRYQALLEKSLQSSEGGSEDNNSNANFAKIALFEQQLGENKITIQTLQNKVKQLQDAANEYEKQIQQLKSDYKDIEFKLDEKSRTVQRLENDIQLLNSKKEDLELHLNQEKMKLKNTDNETREQLSKSSERIHELTTEVNSLNNNNSFLEKKKIELEETIQNLKNSLNEKQSRQSRNENSTTIGTDGEMIQKELYDEQVRINEQLKEQIKSIASGMIGKKQHLIAKINPMSIKQLTLDPIGGLAHSVKMIVQYFDKCSALEPSKPLTHFANANKNAELLMILNYQLLESIRAIFAHKLNDVFWFSTSHHWYVIEEVANDVRTDAMGIRFNQVYMDVQRIIEEEYKKLSEDPGVVIPYSIQEMKFRSFCCVFLSEKKLLNMFQYIISFKSVVDKFYKEDALIRHEDAKEKISKYLFFITKLPIQVNETAHIYQRMKQISDAKQKRETQNQIHDLP